MTSVCAKTGCYLNIAPHFFSSKSFFENSNFDYSLVKSVSIPPIYNSNRQDDCNSFESGTIGTLKLIAESVNTSANYLCIDGKKSVSHKIMRLPCEGEASIKTKSVTDSLLVSSTNDENVLFVTYELYVHSYDKPDGVIIFEIWKESGKQQSTDPVFKPVLETQAKIESTDNTNFYTAVVTLEEGVIKKGDRILCLTRYLSDKKKMFCPKSIKVSLDV